MFSTPLICCSIGVATVAATISALAPGYWPVTLMIGGAISGYCATGSRENETAPTITKMTDTTAAKIGRSMKKCEMRIDPPLSLRLCLGAAGWRRLCFLGGDFLARTHPHQSIDDDAVVGGNAILEHAQLVLTLAEHPQNLAG